MRCSHTFRWAARNPMARTQRPGENLEAEVKALLQLLPGATVLGQQRIGGKAVDIACEVERPFGGKETIVFECKDYAARLTLAEVSEFVRDYTPVSHDPNVTECCLVTRNGIVPNAGLALANGPFKHFEFQDLLQHVLRPGTLLKGLEQQFQADQLDKYYIRTHVYELNLAYASSNFENLYSEFINFGLETGFNFERAREAWIEAARTALERKAPDLIGAELYGKLLSVRRGGSPVDLEKLVLRWLDDPSVSQSLAILGSYGTGKSSFAKRITARAAELFAAGDSRRIPIFFELREFTQHQDIRGLISHNLAGRFRLSNWSFDTFQALNESGRLLIVFDGFDEMKHGLTRDALLYNFDQINSLSVGNSKVILCGRPTAFSSDNEQDAILSGRTTGSIQHFAQYIQLRIAPFSIGDSLKFLQEFSSTRPKVDMAEIRRKILRIEEISETDGNVKALISRPVHLPMLAEILPSIEPSSETLSRSSIYDKFITRIIGREAFRLGRVSSGISLDQRRLFAEELAVLMLNGGESRSLRYSLVPKELIDAFSDGERPFEERKHDLIGACFLERKPPDVLFFPHKSFAEYLAACGLARRMTDPFGTDPAANALSQEVLSFMLEVADGAAWRHVLQAPQSHLRVTMLMAEVAAIAHDQRHEGAAYFASLFSEDAIFQELIDLLPTLPDILVFNLLQVWSAANLHATAKARFRSVCETYSAIGSGALSSVATRYLMPPASPAAALPATRPRRSRR